MASAQHIDAQPTHACHSAAQGAFPVCMFVYVYVCVCVRLCRREGVNHMDRCAEFAKAYLNGLHLYLYLKNLSNTHKHTRDIPPTKFLRRSASCFARPSEEACIQQQKMSVSLSVGMT